MKRSLTFLGVAAALAVMWWIGFVHGQEEQPKKKEPIFVPADEAEFKEVVPSVSKAALWGDHDKGPYGAFTKFAPGYDAGIHTHRTMSGSLFSRVLISTKTMRARSASGRTASYGSRVGRSTGAAGTQKRARSFTKNRPASSIWFLQSRLLLQA